MDYSQTIAIIDVTWVLKDQCSPPYRNHSIDLQSKLFDPFLYDEEHWSLMG